tara:strand:- start:31 stop:1809 length:1779 start_codon:yes stop_codon:yes gene_type:complete
MERNLDNIFDRFYPRSQTVQQGIFLLRTAWAVEILLATIGCLFGIILMWKFTDEEAQVMSFLGISGDGLMMGLIFFMVGIIELTKIPLASAVYYSRTFYIRLTFLVALVAVNISTFETVVAGFERIQNLRTKDFRSFLIQKDTLEDQILEKRVRIDEKNLNKQIEELQNRYTKISKNIEIIENSASKRKNDIERSSNQSAIIESISSQVEQDEKQREFLQSNNTELSKQIKESGFIKNTSANKVIENQITENNEDIKKLTESIGAGRTKLGLAKQKAQVDNKFQLGQIDNQTKRQLKPLQENLIKIQNLIEKYTNDLENIAEINRGNLNEIKTIQDEIDSIVAKIDKEGPDNQVIRVASWFKNYFLIDYELENNKIDKEINNLETSKIFNTFFIWRFQTDRTEKEIDIINDQISKLNDQKLKNEQRIIQEREKGATKTVYSDIPQAALTFAFWIWFGVLSFIVSITGTMLAFASLNLRDPRMHDVLEEKKLKRKGLFWWFVRLLSSWTKNIRVRTRQLFKPNIIEKKVEVEVEKIVEKIIEKPVIQEKIIEKEIEVPKQIEKKVFVHVPFPTDDPEVIKKGPMIYNDKDKKK